MRSVVLATILSFGLLVLGLSSCTKDEPAETTTEMSENTEEALDSTADSVEDAGSEVGQWAQGVETELSTFDNQFAEWKAKMQGKEGEAKYQEKMAELEKMRAEVSNKLENAGEITEENWDEFKSEVEGQVAKMKEKMGEAKN